VLALPVAARADSGDPVSTVALVARAGLSLLAVLAAIAACAWLFRRVSAVATPRARGARLGSLARLDLGARREIRLIRADDRVLVVGVTPDRIDLLTDLGAGAAGADTAAAPALRVLRDLTTSS
jgi:flagellar protein FliO/FliZ